ncbi:hypothetical protein Sme01_23090 [Sphaerisporangium melleum]|uniref:Protein NO VEIN C-terminal domain-containing protein n=2 Tax=Sphaerisporangium melleum TaxID=321316 RepID=A0A917QYW4_9ACTN|nr:hypothetical protein GCM10007964_21280 [Sphaerisporangium melleum]GII69833.1 hypothetical protein Sme01_23090 [Sphaerisporangium melleum]
MTQYGAALDWLRRTGLVTNEGRLTAVHSKIELTILQTAIARADPLWLRDADQLIFNSDDLPEDAASAGETLGLSPQETLAAVRAAWGKVDTSIRENIGSAGEQALVRLLRDLNSLSVTYVAEYADGLGYDVAVAGDGIRLNLEVKATTRRGRLTVYVSRNEFEVMLSDPHWRLVVVLVGQERKAEAIGTVRADWIMQHVPRDASSLGRWESTRFDIPPTAVHKGIVELAEHFGEGHLLRGGTTEARPVWLMA